MNILPVVQLASAAQGFLADLFPGSRNAADFSDQLRQAKEEAGNNSGHSRDIRERIHAAAQNSRHGDAQNDPSFHDAAAFQAFDANENSRNKTPQQFTPLEKAPIVPHSVNSTLYHVGEVNFTQQELAKLRDKLLREGLTPKALTVIEQLASHPHGATLGQLLALMHGSAVQTVALSKDETAILQNFADKIDGSGTLGKNMLHLLENGRHKEAWDALKTALATVSQQDQLVIEAGEAALLCKAFGVSQAASLAILKNFGQADGLPLTPEIFTALMLPAQQEILDRAEQDGKLSQALAKHLQPLIDEARRRSELERKAAEGADRRSKHTEILIRDKFMDSFRKDVAAPEKDEVRQHPFSGKQDAFGRQEEQSGKTENLAARTLRQEDAAAAQDRNKAAVAAKAPDEAPASKKSASELEFRAEMDEWRNTPQRPRGEQHGGGNNESHQDARRDSQTLLSRLEVRHNAQTSDTNAFSSFAMPAQPQEQGAGQTPNPASNIRQALQQMEQGTLNRLANGGQRLELQLAPSELGAVTLILTSGKGGEISATIRSERSETAELVARHLDIIRVNLEEQGLKVDKLEVRQQMLNDQNDWQGMEQHNAMREEQERREHLERLRRLGRQGGNETLQARDVQIHEHSAEISGQGLHLVA